MAGIYKILLNITGTTTKYWIVTDFTGESGQISTKHFLQIWNRFPQFSPSHWWTWNNWNIKRRLWMFEIHNIGNLLTLSLSLTHTHTHTLGYFNQFQSEMAGIYKILLNITGTTTKYWIVTDFTGESGQISTKHFLQIWNRFPQFSPSHWWTWNNWNIKRRLWMFEIHNIGNLLTLSLSLSLTHTHTHTQ